MIRIPKQFSVAGAIAAAAAVVLLPVASALANPAAVVLTPPLVKPDTTATFSRQFVGMHIHNANNTADWPSAANAATTSTGTAGGTPGAYRFWDGAGTWAEVQPTAAGAWNFSRADLYVSRVTASGARSLLVLARTPAWASARPLEASAYGPGMAAEAANMETWRLYVRTMVTRYKGKIEAYQVWNEANTTPFWTGTTAALVQMTCAAYDEIKKVDPAALVVSPSGTGAYDARTIWVKQFLDAGGAKCVDVVSYHLYTGGSGPENFVVPMISLQKSLYDAGYRFRYWNTETGYLAPNSTVTALSGWSAYELSNQVTDAVAASYTVRAMLLARALGFERFYWYAWDNARLGFTQPSTFQERLNATFLKQFEAWFEGAALNGCSRSAAGVWVCNATFAAPSIFAGMRGSVVWVDPAAAPQSQTITVIRGSVLQFNPALNPVFTVTTVKSLPAVSTMTVNSVPQLLLWK